MNQRALAAGGEADGSRQIAKSRPCPDGDHGCRIRGEGTGGRPAKIAVPGKFAKNGGEQSGGDGPKKQTNACSVLVHGVTWAVPSEGAGERGREGGNGMYVRLVGTYRETESGGLGFPGVSMAASTAARRRLAVMVHERSIRALAWRTEQAMVISSDRSSFGAWIGMHTHTPHARLVLKGWGKWSSGLDSPDPNGLGFALVRCSAKQGVGIVRPACALHWHSAWVKRQPWPSRPSAAVVKQGIINHARTVAAIAFFADIGLREGCLEQTLEPGAVWGDETNHPPHPSFIHCSRP